MPDSRNGAEFLKIVLAEMFDEEFVKIASYTENDVKEARTRAYRTVPSGGTDPKIDCGRAGVEQKIAKFFLYDTKGWGGKSDPLISNYLNGTDTDFLDLLQNPASPRAELKDTDSTYIEIKALLDNAKNGTSGASPPPSTTEKGEDYAEWAEVLKLKKNIILEGPPGTGKTYSVEKIAKEVDGLNENAAGNGEWGLTMHPATSYEDFIEGLRPKKGKKIGYEYQPGIFVERIRDAIKNPTQKHIVLLDELNRCNVPRVLGDLLTTIEAGKRTKLITQSNKDSDSSTIFNSCRIVCCKIARTGGNPTGFRGSVPGLRISANDDDEITYIICNDVGEYQKEKFDITDRDIPAGLWEGYPKVIHNILTVNNEKELILIFIDGVGHPVISTDFAQHVLDPVTFSEAPESVEVLGEDGPRKYLVKNIEETTRIANAPCYDAEIYFDPIANCKCPVGENYYWCDYCDEKWDKLERTEVSLSGSKKRLHVPDNLLVIGTMNTTDRSVAPLDSALRRRFVFIRLDPMSEFPSDESGKVHKDTHFQFISVVSCWRRLNERLRACLGGDATIGHSYLFDLCKEFVEVDGDEERTNQAEQRFWSNSILPQIADLLDATGSPATIWEKIGMTSPRWKRFGLGLDTPSGLESQTYSRTVVITSGKKQVLSKGQEELVKFMDETVNSLPGDFNKKVEGEVLGALSDLADKEVRDDYNWQEGFSSVLNEQEIGFEDAMKEKEELGDSKKSEKAADEERVKKEKRKERVRMKTLTVAELKDELRILGKLLTGDKAGLLKRLLDTV